MSETREQQERRDGPGPIAITGIHRSGTSMMAKALLLAGLHLGNEGDFLEPAPDNPRGFFEHAGFVDLGEDLLGAVGGAWDHVPPCPPMGADDQRVAGLRPRAEQLAAELGVVPRWGWKDPRTCLTIRFWLDLWPGLRTVVCVRHPLEVALSLKRRNNTSYAHSLSLWHAYYETLLEATTPERRIVTHYDAHFREPERELGRVIAFVGLPEAAVAAASEAREPGLRHHQLRLGLAEAGVDPATIGLYARLLEEAEMPEQDDREGEPSRAPAKIDRDVVDLAAARGALQRRERQVSSLERQRDELTDRVSDLELLTRPGSISELVARIDRLEERLHESRYARETLAGWEDPAIVHGCRELVRRHVPLDQEVLVIAKGDPALLDLYGRPSINFPSDASGRYPGFAPDHGLAAVGHLEARRLRGSRFLLIPEIASWWLDHFPDLATHLADRHRVVAEESGVGLLIDLAVDPGAALSGCSVESAIDDLLDSAVGEPTVLDWTSRDLVAKLSRYNAFAPPPGETLPYLAGTIDVILIDDVDLETAGSNGSEPMTVRLEEAGRVASRGVVAVAGGGLLYARGTIASASGEGSVPHREPIRLAVNAAEPDSNWLAHLREAIGRPAEISLAEEATWAQLAEAGPIVGAIEEGVLPLPGCWEAARRTLERGEDVGAVAVKLLAADGSLEAAGTAIFADGSLAGVAAGTHQISAPWHEYVRETAGAAGLLVLGAEGLRRLAEAQLLLAGGTPTAWAAALWERGLRVVYQPEAVAVRAIPPRAGVAASAGRITQGWASGLKQRPARPDRLDEAHWREILAREEIGASG